MQMTNVTLAIGGRSLTISVAAGEEAHAEMLGRMIDDRVRRLGTSPPRAKRACCCSPR
jgi:cell division protein ZapA